MLQNLISPIQPTYQCVFILWYSKIRPYCRLDTRWILPWTKTTYPAIIRYGGYRISNSIIWGNSISFKGQTYLILKNRYIYIFEKLEVFFREEGYASTDGNPLNPQCLFPSVSLQTAIRIEICFFLRRKHTRVTAWFLSSGWLKRLITKILFLNYSDLCNLWANSSRYVYRMGFATTDVWVAKVGCSNSNIDICFVIFAFSFSFSFFLWCEMLQTVSRKCNMSPYEPIRSGWVIDSSQNNFIFFRTNLWPAAALKYSRFLQRPSGLMKVPRFLKMNKKWK